MLRKNSVRCGDLEAAKAMEELILSKKQEGDSIEESLKQSL